MVRVRVRMTFGRVILSRLNQSYIGVSIFKIQDSRFKIQDWKGFKDLFQHSKKISVRGFQYSIFKIQYSRFKIQDSRFKIQDSKKISVRDRGSICVFVFVYSRFMN